jgi:UDP-glucuronate 4-epimerase
MPMMVLVTGVCGLIGGQVAEALSARGEQVVGYDARSPADDARIAGVAYVRGDLNDSPRLYGTFKAFGITHVVHAGAISAPFLEADNPFLVCQTNILGTVNVYEAARLFGVARLVNFGSESGYGAPAVERIDEDTPLRPTTVYGVTKATSDLLGSVYAAQLGLDVVSLRPCLVYGPRRPSYEPVKELIRSGLTGVPATLRGEPGQTHQAVYAADVAQAVLAALTAPTLPRRSYNVTAGEITTLAQVVERVREPLPGAAARYVPDPIAAPEPRPVIDITAISQDLGYRPGWPLDRGIADYARWLREHRE